MQKNDWLDRIEAGEIPHAILFAGPKESGMLALARRAAARYLLHRATLSPLGEKVASCCFPLSESFEYESFAISYM